MITDEQIGTDFPNPTGPGGLLDGMVGAPAFPMKCVQKERGFQRLVFYWEQMELELWAPKMRDRENETHA